MFKHDVLALCALVAWGAWGIGYLIMTDMEYSSRLKEQCIAAGKQIVAENCINE